MTLSPFSLFHNWELKWQRPRMYKRSKYLGNSKKEKRVIESLAIVGVIGGKQLSDFYNINRNDKKKMVRHGKIMRHDIKQNNKLIPIFTLGPNGADMINLANYKQGYWLTYDVSDVLKRLLFFELFHKFPKARLTPAPAPFVGAIQYRKNTFYVYVVRGDMNDLLMHLKWETSSKRMIIITESINHLQPLNIYANDLHVRVTTDKDLGESFQKMFYKWDNGWVKESAERKQSKIINL